MTCIHMTIQSAPIHFFNSFSAPQLLKDAGAEGELDRLSR
jgi:hypothetical protein